MLPPSPWLKPSTPPFNARRLIAEHGVEAARRRTGSKFERMCVDAAAILLAPDAPPPEAVHASPLVRSLPYREPMQGHLPAAIWRRQAGAREYILAGEAKMGIPFGAKARIILIEMHTAALRQRARLLETGFSRHAYLRHLGLADGGMTYKSFIGQWCRLATCRFSLRQEGRLRWSGGLVERVVGAGEGTADRSREALLGSKAILISEEFYALLEAEQVALSLPALQLINDNAWAIDLYIWLAQTLPSLKAAALFDWPLLEGLFGANYRRRRQVRASLVRALPLVLAVYPEAAAEAAPGGLMLRPSPPPI